MSFPKAISNRLKGVVKLVDTQGLTKQLIKSLSVTVAYHLFPEEKRHTIISDFIKEVYLKSTKFRHFYPFFFYGEVRGIVVVDVFNDISIIKLSVLHHKFQGKGLMKKIMKKVINNLPDTKALFIKTANPRMATLLNNLDFSILDDVSFCEHKSYIREYELIEGFQIKNSTVPSRQLVGGQWMPALQRGTQKMEDVFRRLKSNSKDRVVFIKCLKNK